MIYKMTLADSADSMTFDLLEVPIADKDVEGAVDNTLVNGNVFTDYLWLKKQWTQKWALMCDDEYTQLRGFYTRQWENAEAPTYRLFYGNNITEDVMRNGSYIAENIDAPLGAEMTLTQLSGNAEQTTYSGKNLIDFDTATLYTSASVDSTRQGNGFKSTIQASTSSTALPTYYNSGMTIPAGTYTVSFEARCQNSNSLLLNIQGYIIGQRGDLKDASGATASEAYRTLNSTWKKFSFTITTSSAQTFGTPNALHLYFLAPSGSQVFELQNPMLESGNTATSYEPYVGGTASPNPDYPQAIETVTGGQVVSVVGKNLLDASKATADRRLGVSGTLATDAGFSTSDFIRIEPNTSYTFSMAQVGSTFFGSVCQYDADKNFVGVRDYIAPTATFYTFTSRADAQYVRYSNQSTIFGTSLMFELGSTATTYEPYQAQSYEINLGKNLLDVSNVNSGSGSNGLTMTANSDGSLTWAGTTTSTWAIMTNYTTVNLKAGTYTLSIDKTLAYRFYVEAMLEDNTTQNMIIEAGQTSKTVTFAKGIKQIRLDLANFTNGQAYNETVKAQLEQSATPTDFAPYFTPIELAGVGEIQPDGLPKYRDTIKPIGGKWYIEKQVGKVVFSGASDEAWTQATTSGQIYWYVGISDSMNYTRFDSSLLSNNFTYRGENDANGFYMNAHNLVIFNHGLSATTADDFKTWLSTHNTTVYYALATPTTTEITDETLLSQLNIIANLYGGVNHISIVPSAGAQGTMEVKIHKIYEQETEIYPQTAVRLTLTDDGIINPCGCRRNVQIKMRETIQ